MCNDFSFDDVECPSKDTKPCKDAQKAYKKAAWKVWTKSPKGIEKMKKWKK